MHKTIFTWFGNLPTSTELQGFHYKIRRYNSAQEHSQETQFPIHPNSLSPTRQENTILSSYAATRLLGIISNYLYFVLHITTYICVCVINQAGRSIPFTIRILSTYVDLGLAIQATHGPLQQLWV